MIFHRGSPTVTMCGCGWVDGGLSTSRVRVGATARPPPGARRPPAQLYVVATQGHCVVATQGHCVVATQGHCVLATQGHLCLCLTRKRHVSVQQ